MKKNPLVTIQMTNHPIPMVLELYVETAKNTVANFVQLIERGFYNGLIFHRVIPGFMIQGGCPNGNGMGGPGYHIPGEFSANGVKNDLKHDRGVLSMARAASNNSGGSQFFIMHQNSPSLDRQYAAFGKLISGFETLDAIASVRVGANDKPIQEQKIASMRVELFGHTFAPVITC